MTTVVVIAPKSHNNREAWTTKDEIDFIMRLGTFSHVGLGASKLILLRGYREAFSKRSNWGRISVKEVWEAIKREMPHEDHSV